MSNEKFGGTNSFKKKSLAQYENNLGTYFEV